MFVILNHLYLKRKEVFAEFPFRLVSNLIPRFLHVLLDLPEMLARFLRVNAPVLCQQASLGSSGANLFIFLFCTLTPQNGSWFLFPGDFNCCDIA